MQSFQYQHGGLTLVISARNQSELDMVDVYGDGNRRSFQGSGIIIDFGVRMVLEEPGATLEYRVLEGTKTVLSVGGQPRTHREGELRSAGVPKIYAF